MSDFNGNYLRLILWENYYKWTNRATYGMERRSISNIYF